MALEITGRLYKKMDAETKGASFTVREFVIEIMDGQYPQLVKFQLVQERTALLDQYQEGEPVKVHFDLRGREWQGKFLTSLHCWKMEKGEGDTTVKTNSSAAPKTVSQPVASGSAGFPAEPPAKSDEADDDLPF